MWVAVSRVCCCRKYYLLGPCKFWPYSVFRLQSLEVGDDNYSHQVLLLKDLNLPKPDKWGTSQLPSFIQQVQSGRGRAYTWFYHSKKVRIALAILTFLECYSYVGTLLYRHTVITSPDMHYIIGTFCSRITFSYVTLIVLMFKPTCDICLPLSW